MVNPEITQASLLSRVRDPNNHQAWREFEAKYRDLIVRYCRKRGLQTMDAEDVLQTVMTGMVQAMPSFVYDRNRGQFRTYLYRAVKNAIIRQSSRPNASHRGLDTSMLAAVPDRDEAALEALWTQEWVHHHYRLALAQVRTSFDARSIEIFERSVRGESIEHLASAFSTSTQAVHKIRQRLRTRIRELIEQQVREEEIIDDSPAAG